MQSDATGRRIGLFGGSFDPPHLGHVALVQAGLTMGLDKVYVIPALPVHRALSGHADAHTRFDWLRQMFAEEACVQVVDWEISRQRPTPAIETLRQFHHMHPDTTPWLMMGTDAWNGLPTWREYPAHRNLCNVAVFARRGQASETVCRHHGWQRLNLNPFDLKKMDLKHGSDCNGPGHQAYVQVALPDISATALRRDAMQGAALTGRVADIICRQIEQAYGKATEKM